MSKIVSSYLREMAERNLAMIEAVLEDLGINLYLDERCRGLIMGLNDSIKALWQRIAELKGEEAMRVVKALEKKGGEE